ncbi:MAG TPA: hypothetical protein VFK88_02505 [Gallionella sp.]|nr:hypothetical protein [Gallionella sp.]
MVMTIIPDIAYEIDGDDINLEQDAGLGEVNRITMHRMHLDLLAKQMGMPQPEPRIATLERRLRWLRDRFEECHAVLPSDMHERCPEASEFSIWLQASIDVANEYCDDLTPQNDAIKGVQHG